MSINLKKQDIQLSSTQKDVFNQKVIKVDKKLKWWTNITIATGLIVSIGMAVIGFNAISPHELNNWDPTKEVSADMSVTKIKKITESLPATPDSKSAKIAEANKKIMTKSKILDHEFDTILGLLDSSLVKAAAMIMLLFGVAQGLVSQSMLPVLASVMATTMLTWGPSVIGAIVQAPASVESSTVKAGPQEPITIEEKIKTPVQIKLTKQLYSCTLKKGYCENYDADIVLATKDYLKNNQAVALWYAVMLTTTKQDLLKAGTVALKNKEFETDYANAYSQLVKKADEGLTQEEVAMNVAGTLSLSLLPVLVLSYRRKKDLETVRKALASATA